MEDRRVEWKVDYNQLIPFLGKTIYRPENVLVELCANSYDADAENVEIVTKGDLKQILIKDDGCGMNLDDINDLITIAKSKKKKMKITKKFHRKILGSFGIGIISFFALGDYIKIFTFKKGYEPIFIEIKKVFNEDRKLENIIISDPIESYDYMQHLINKENGTTIEIDLEEGALKLNDTKQYNLIKYKLSNLPLKDNFKLTLNDIQIKKDDFLEEDWIKKEFDIILDTIDPLYKSRCEIYVNTKEAIEKYKRGIYLVVNGRVIERDLFSEILTELPSPGTISARNIGFIHADYLAKSIQANREDFFDSNIIEAIKEKIKSPISQMIEDYKIQKKTDETDKIYNNLLQRIQNAQNKYESPNRYLKELGINFASTPEHEQELVLIIAQLCQNEYLPFRILDYNSVSHIDCIVQWPMKQEKRYPNFISEIEVELSLDGFFKHNHDFRTKPDICCWKINVASFEKEKQKYIKGRPESVQSIELKDAINEEHFGHQKELHFTINYQHNEQKIYILRVYVINEIIKIACKK
nr:ATP-binding protein [Clostridium sp. ZBS4]